MSKHLIHQKIPSHSQNKTEDIKYQKPEWLINIAPWMAGVGIAVGHVLTSSNCSIPKQGNCSACGSCVVALSSLTAWAVLKQKSNDQPFYEQTKK